MGAKKFGMPLETQGNQTLWRDIPGFLPDIPGVSEKFERRKFVFNFWPLTVCVSKSSAPKQDRDWKQGSFGKKVSFQKCPFESFQRTKKFEKKKLALISRPLASHVLGTSTIGQPGHRTMEMNGRSTASSLTRAPRVRLLTIGDKTITYLIFIPDELF